MKSHHDDIPIALVAPPKRLSLRWTRSALHLTVPTRNLVRQVICQDDCARCPLFTNGCAGACMRWDDAVCLFCPCLGSRHTTERDVRTVDPDDDEREHPAVGGLMLIRARRRELEDGQPV